MKIAIQRFIKANTMAKQVITRFDVVFSINNINREDIKDIKFIPFRYLINSLISICTYLKALVGFGNSRNSYADNLRNSL